jgi:hypothetical protein
MLTSYLFRHSLRDEADYDFHLDAFGSKIYEEPDGGDKKSWTKDCESDPS